MRGNNINPNGFMYQIVFFVVLTKIHKCRWKKILPQALEQIASRKERRERERKREKSWFSFIHMKIRKVSVRWRDQKTIHLRKCTQSPYSAVFVGLCRCLIMPPISFGSMRPPFFLTSYYLYFVITKMCVRVPRFWSHWCDASYVLWQLVV